ncbi:signal peptidase I [Phocaeicola sp.]|uniref:signal peptidase I n=1 Tax=Phocaeicola sp. TaxID=2773926 RepID=UPI003A8F4837
MRMPDKEKQKKVAEKWGNRLVNFILALSFCFVTYVLLQVFAVTSFKIPSDSMEPSLLAGDYILVDKCSGGARLFDLLGALEKEEVKIHRVPGWRNFKRNDVLVFNFPYPGRWDSLALDMMQYYVKRCIAVPGDTLEIRDAHYAIRGLELIPGDVSAQDELQKVIESGTAEERGIVLESYPNREEIGWDIQKFGPLYIPGKGSTVRMDFRNRLLYSNMIEWEQKKRLSVRGDSVLLGDSVIRQYCFRENYYFVSGDKMINSRDSRYWGLLPEPFVVGKVALIWKSQDTLNGKIRWNRVLKKVE